MKTESAFWDTSAIVPLCWHQDFSVAARRAYREYPKPIIWWGTAVEIRSAFSRLKPFGSQANATSAMRLWNNFRRKAGDVFPDDQLLAIAEEIPEKYGLRSLDAFQLAAALRWCSERPRNRPFISADARLSEAASDAGFGVIDIG